jgi:hypothetical protein
MTRGVRSTVVHRDTATDWSWLSPVQRPFPWADGAWRELETRYAVASRKSRAQIQAQLRQAQQKQRQAINKYNADARAHNRKVQQAVSNYNTAVRRHNAAVRSNRVRLQRELTALQSHPRSPRTTAVYGPSVVALVESFTRLESAETHGGIAVAGDLFDLSENEAANSVAVLNALLADPPTSVPTDEVIGELRRSTITEHLHGFNSDLAARWSGALFALHPDNPDAARHFCTSAREMLARMLELVAPDEDVLAHDPDCPKTDNGSVSRRARIYYCLNRQGEHTAELAAFVEADLDNVLDLFQEFNAGTHGEAGHIPIAQLAAIKARVEDAVRFVHRIAFTAV